MADSTPTTVPPSAGTALPLPPPRRHRCPPGRRPLGSGGAASWGGIGMCNAMPTGPATARGSSATGGGTRNHPFGSKKRQELCREHNA